MIKINEDCIELDGYYACLYGHTHNELRYTPFGVDPKEVHGEGFPGETFRVLKEKEVKQFGDAPRTTRRLVLEAHLFHRPARCRLVWIGTGGWIGDLALAFRSALGQPLPGRCALPATLNHM